MCPIARQLSVSTALAEPQVGATVPQSPITGPESEAILMTRNRIGTWED